MYGSSDQAVIETNDDATSCKVSIHLLNYIKDPFVEFFSSSNEIKPPLINRGYFGRVYIVHKLIEEFRKTTNDNCQVVSFGSGFDTLFWNLKGEIPFIEMDFESVVQKKIKTIMKNKELSELVKNYEMKENELTSEKYSIFSVDLRNFEDMKNKVEKMAKKDTPTIFISECVLIYIKPNFSKEIIHWTSKFKESCFIIYEQIKPYDSFGKMMIKNLQKRNCPLLSIEEYPTMDSQSQRFIDLGYTKSGALDMYYIYNKLIDESERKRIEKIEIFDEYEEWKMILDHYCIVFSGNFEKYEYTEFMKKFFKK